ncbi:hypothetical protein AJ80_02454 [Polytolypa hystricis UAMH7299]|uniref:Uncharacterized protein n=1 Tax=Polytolypa hystricis (strain UAMH7299) TaxID=1447883 RepID=A0A2B7YQR2_POLH7|nr:hypothetical protein AJ80_02454 [Polytolypa hystricis UAMH7299]
MGRSEPPFLYDPPTPTSHLNNFNPRAVTQATWAPRSEPRTQKNAPLISFNKHPDSWAGATTGKFVKTMSPKTKGRVKYTRFFLLGLRICALIGALGILFCVIVINKLTLPVAWMIRVAPAVSILHTLYGVYHLCRSATARTPASSASYMLFASVLDAGVIPFYVFTAIMAQAEYTSGRYKWGTLFNIPEVEPKIFYSTFLACTAVGEIHMASLVISVYLAVIFRKIAKLPPDMNPLEDNLTARPHKRTKSELTEKRISQATTATVDSNRMSMTHDPLITPTRTVPFAHTRMDSASNPSLSKSESRQSDRTSYYSVQSHRFSRSDLPSQQFMNFEQENGSKTYIARTPAKRRGSTSSRPRSMIIDTPPPLNVSRPGSTREPSAADSSTSDNWVVHPSPSPSPPLHTANMKYDVSPLPSRFGTPTNVGGDIVEEWNGSASRYDTPNRSGTVVRSKNAYAPLDDSDDDENQYNMTNKYDFERDLAEHLPDPLNIENKAPRASTPYNPLEMNPPTPQPVESEVSSSYTPRGSLRRLALTDIQNPPVNSGRSTPVKEPGKMRSYGDLDSPHRDVSEDQEDTRFSAPGSNSKNKGLMSRWRRVSGRMSTYDPINVDDDDNDSGNEDNFRSTMGDSDRKGRVVSNSGIDLGNGMGSGSPSYSNYIAGLGVGRRRDVSGKVAEEGRGGAGLHEIDESPKPKERGLSKSSEIKAAGWARFKGL